MENNFVYHSSKEQGIKTLRPNKSTHGEEWVYATSTLEMSAVFLNGRGGDLSCQVGREKSSGKVYICERFQNAFDYRYKNASGSIYFLSQDNFEKNKTGWSEEVISKTSVDVIKEERIDDVKNYILNLVNEDKILFVKYPNKINNLPEDDEDLVFRGILWARQFGESILDDFKKLHPNLIDRINRGLKDNKYPDGRYE